MIKSKVEELLLLSCGVFENNLRSWITAVKACRDLKADLTSTVLFRVTSSCCISGALSGGGKGEVQRGEAEEERAPQHAGGEDRLLPARGHVSVFDRSCSLLFYASCRS